MSTFKKSKVLITGGLGFVGSNLAIRLVKAGAKVEVLDALIAGMGGNRFNVDPIKKYITVVTGDLRDGEKVTKSVRNKDFIFNLAGTLSHIDSMRDPFLDLDINCRAQLCLLEAVRKSNPSAKIIFAGTRNQYGKALYLPIDEKHLQEPTDINGINSIAAEKYHLLYNKIYGIRSVSLRMTNTFGPRHQMRHAKQGVLNWFLRLLIEGKKVVLFGDGLQIRDLNYVDEAVDALMLAALSKKVWGEAYNLGGHPITLLEFVEKAIKVHGGGKFEIRKFPSERKTIEIGNYVADIKKIKNDLGWSPSTSIEDGIVSTFNYYNKFKKKYWDD